MRILGILIMMLGLFSVNLLAGDAEFTSNADAFFSKYVQGNNVNYEAASKSDALKELIQCIADVEIDQLSDLEKQAFFVNAYNLLVINSVSKNLPTESVMDIPKFFDQEIHNVGGNEISLNQLEKKMLLKEFPNPLFHFILVCGAVDCPPIAPYAYTADKLDVQLKERTTKALNDPNFIRVNEEGTQLSKIFEWYASDFGGSKKAIIEFINTYRENPISDGFSYYEYDWSLNKGEFDTGSISEESSETTLVDASDIQKKK